MSTEVVKVIDASEIESKNVEVGEWGLEFKGQLTPQEWYEAALAIQKFDGKLQWYLGDLAVYAESPVTGWGESKYADLIDATGYSYQTLRHFAKVARKFSSSFRERIMESVPMSAHVSFSHFNEVASLEEAFAEYWLRKAADNGWGVAKLREEINRDKETPEKAEKPIGFISFGDRMKEFFKGYMPNLTQEEYDEKSWLLEVHDVIEERLHELGIEL